jgi:hypothetical protein
VELHSGFLGRFLLSLAFFNDLPDVRVSFEEGFKVEETFEIIHGLIKVGDILRRPVITTWVGVNAVAKEEQVAEHMVEVVLTTIRIKVLT